LKELSKKQYQKIYLLDTIDRRKNGFADIKNHSLSMIGFAVILERFCYLELPKSEVDISKQTKETIYDWGNSATAEEYN